MRLVISSGIALAVALAAVAPAIDGAAGPKRPADVKVKVTLRDAAGDRIQSDGGGVYRDGIDGVVAYIAASDNGQLIFGTATNQGSRTMRFFFDDCLWSPEPCRAPWPYLNERSGILANALRNGSVPAGGLTAMAIDEELSLWIKGNIPLDSDPAYWNFCFDARKAVGPCGLAPGATSTDARIRRDEAGWTIYATTDDRADLIRDSQSKRNRTISVEGTYAMPFSLSVEACADATCS